ncbi:hypothetical protein CEE37_10190 [candidate division LCP-89 bacterium B3_LCP]|uniref:Peptidase MA-like domain-containing protein n=1 Tax=candidate division LCP-89 bacterium B3_LCP TaxID=2012998 RepID=A0A532UYT8_UNCL8|nr:MAG: hypothetical protein CEE37_10190 [candidate division LCP-89 bacterium B3_LCP]
MSKFRWVLVIILLLQSAAASLTTRDWKEESNAHFQVYHHDTDASNVTALLKALIPIKIDLEEQLQIKLAFPARIFLTSNQEEFDRITGGRLPVWSQGVSFPTTGVIVLKSPGFSHDMSTFHKTAAHELVHLIIGVRTGNNIPRWLNEGLAQMLSGEGPGKPMARLSRALWSGTLISLKSIEHVDSFSHSQADLAYLQSYHAAEFLIKQYGWEALHEIMGYLNQNLPFDDALYRTLEMDSTGFEAAWLASLNRSYRWVILLDLHLYLFLGATILVIAAGISVIRRRKKIYRKWEAEDGPQEDIF